MPEGIPPTAAASAAPRPPARGRTALAWLVIVLVVGALFTAPLLLEPDPEGAETMAVATLETQARLMVGIAEFARQQGTGGSPPVNAEQTRLLEQGPPLLRMRVAVMAGDLIGPEEARASLGRLTELVEAEDRELSDTEAGTLAALETLYAEEAPGTDAEPAHPDRLADDERRLLVDHLGWFGELALAPPGVPAVKADREQLLGGSAVAMVVLVVLGIGGLLLLLAGTVGLFVFLFMAGSGRLAMHFRPTGLAGGIWAETFAAWLVLFWGGSLLIGLVLPDDLALTGALAAQVLGLGALAWPCLRGLDFTTVRREVGLHADGNPIVEVLAGAAGWVMSLPMLAVGVAFTLALALIATAFQPDLGPFAVPASPGHPVQAEILGGTSAVILLLVAAVGAPVTEEIFFRGVLYRHLREATAGTRRAVSILASTAITGFIFAAVHPQGWIAIPALAAVSTGLVLVREWRDGLIAAIAFHALHNGLLITGSLLLMGS